MKQRKKILILGGSYFQIPAIKYAKEAGYYVITCDYLPDSPGHKFSDAYYNISTIEKENVLSLAKRLKVDAVVPYGTEPGAPTAAYISKKMNLPGNDYQGVLTLIEKDKFRAFLKKNNFNTPVANGFENLIDAKHEIKDFKLPVMVKPVDSAASKGVSILRNIDNLKEAFYYALGFSKVKRVIIEEYIERIGPQIHGDAFLVDGKMVFCYLGDTHYDLSINTFIPCATTLPSIHAASVLDKVQDTVQQILTKLNFKQGAVNIEARIDKNDNVFIIEIGPRNGGHIVPQFERHASGFDMIKNTVEVFLGHNISIKKIKKEGFFALYAIHTNLEGSFKKVTYKKQIHSYILEKHIIKNKGDIVKSFSGVNNAVGFIILKFPTFQIMEYIVSNMSEFIEVEFN